MIATKLKELAESQTLIEQCNRWVNGECSTRSCLIRGGYFDPGSAKDRDCATCETNEIILALYEAADEINSLTTELSVYRSKN